MIDEEILLLQMFVQIYHAHLRVCSGNENISFTKKKKTNSFADSLMEIYQPHLAEHVIITLITPPHTHTPLNHHTPPQRN